MENDKIKLLYNEIKKLLIVALCKNEIKCKLPKSTRIGHYAMCTTISKEVKFGENCIIRSNSNIGTPVKYRKYPNAIVRIGNNVELGIRVSIMCRSKNGLTIGDNSIICAGAIVLKDVPPNTIVKGVWK
jgi:serine acetyltransferase